MQTAERNMVDFQKGCIAAYHQSMAETGNAEHGKTRVRYRSSLHAKIRFLPYMREEIMSIYTFFSLKQWLLTHSLYFSVFIYLACTIKLSEFLWR